MYDNYFREFHVSEQELKEKIHSTIKTLTIFEPERYLVSLLEDMNPHKDSEEILENLFEYPELLNSEIQLSEGTVIEKLRCSAIQLDILADGYMLNHLITRMMFKTHSSLLLVSRYLMATGVLERKLGYELLNDPEEICNVLQNSNRDAITLNDTFIATRKAWEEIDRLCAIDKEGDLFKELILDFENAIEDYVKKNLLSVASEQFGLLLFEGWGLNVNRLTKYVSEEDFSPNEINEILDKTWQKSRQNSNKRVGRTRGGARNREGFFWGNQEKLEFYKTIESLPKLKWKNDECDIWQYAYKLLESAGAESVKSHPRLQDLPPDLFVKAIKEWRSSVENSVNLKADAKPRVFMFKHSLRILEFPETYAFSTLQKHYEMGRKLFLDSNSQNEL